MSTDNIGFYEDLTKIIFELSLNFIKYAPYFFFWVCVSRGATNVAFVVLFVNFVFVKLSVPFAVVM